MHRLLGEGIIHELLVVPNCKQMRYPTMNSSCAKNTILFLLPIVSAIYICDTFAEFKTKCG